jgi:hypothetical protein
LHNKYFSSLIAFNSVSTTANAVDEWLNTPPISNVMNELLGGHGSEWTSISTNGQEFFIHPRYVDAATYTINIGSNLLYFMQLSQLMLSAPSRGVVLPFPECTILYWMKVHGQHQCWELGMTCLEQSLVTISWLSSKRKARDLQTINLWRYQSSHVLVYNVLCHHFSNIPMGTFGYL